MSFASILSEPATTIRTPTMAPSVPKASRKTSASQKTSPMNVDSAEDAAQERETSVVAAYGGSDVPAGLSIQMNGYTPAPKPRKVLTAQENDKVSTALALIDEAVFSDVETSGFDAEKGQYLEKSKKRALEVGELETRKRKVCNLPLRYTYQAH